MPIDFDALNKKVEENKSQEVVISRALYLLSKIIETNKEKIGKLIGKRYGNAKIEISLKSEGMFITVHTNRFNKIYGLNVIPGATIQEFSLIFSENAALSDQPNKLDYSVDISERLLMEAVEGCIQRVLLTIIDA